MSAFWFVVAVCLWISYVSARDRGVPWFSLGGTRRQRLSKPAPKASVARKAKSRAVVNLFAPLDELTHDEGASIRLVQGIAERNPGRDTRWCVEKAIYDIERDRMAR